MHCHLERNVVPASIGRLYQPGRTFENRDPFESSFVLKHHLDQPPEICAVDKPLTKEEMKAIKRCLKELGVTGIMLERNGKTLFRQWNRKT